MDKIKSLEDEISALKRSPIKERKIKVKDGVYLTWGEDRSSQPWCDTLSIEYEDKYHILTFDEIYDLINSNKVLDLNKIESKLS